MLVTSGTSDCQVRENLPTKEKKRQNLHYVVPSSSLLVFHQSTGSVYVAETRSPIDSGPSFFQLRSSFCCSCLAPILDTATPGIEYPEFSSLIAEKGFSENFYIDRRHPTSPPNGKLRATVPHMGPEKAPGPNTISPPPRFFTTLRQILNQLVKDSLRSH